MAPSAHNGNTYLPFSEMIEVEKINDDTFRSIAPPFSPGGTGRAYGGHVYAQAVWAAAQTVKKGFVVHNVTGFFTLPGMTEVPFVYSVSTVRDGRSYCTRTVNVTQAEGKGICFTCTCSFKTVEDNRFDVQEEVNLEKEYGVVLEGKRPDDWPEAPGVDMSWYWRRREETGVNDDFPGLDARKVDMTAYNQPRTPFERRQLLYYRLIGTLPPDPNMHACAHLYASDRNSLFIVANHLDVGELFTQMASLSHTVVFHTPIADMMMMAKHDASAQEPGQEQDTRLWFCKEDWTNRAGGGRGIHQSRMWGPTGVHVASSWQEGMIRIGKEVRQDPPPSFKL
ncbi:hypothetical protein LTR50_004060 [Elasticomyces elasticus]|nr:hypothetical protein LTR50_004060 [Elasticomyces elasticus]